MSYTLRQFSRVIAVAFPMAVVAHQVTYYLLEFGSILIQLLVGLLGIGALITTIVAATKVRSRQALIAVVIVVTTWAVWVLAPTRMLGAYTRFFLQLNTYETAVSELRSGISPVCVKVRACQLDAGPPARLAFSWGGILDNWVGIIYDPTDEVTNTERYRKLFGGDLVVCEALKQHYYICSFT